jgi:geranylgeranyl pyrophosphate synthase
MPWELWREALYGPLRDFLGRPGKEFRARLVGAAFRLGGRSETPPAELPLIVELLHAGSLIVDDIEDGSAYRRGEPALHCTYGLPRALNAGNWLYFWPMSLIERLDVAPEARLALYRTISQTLLRCHSGQALDLSARVGGLSQRDVARVVEVTTSLKTGALMELAAAIGAIAAGAPSARAQAIAEFGMRLGTGLQMLDDLGGLTSEKRCHKGHEDLLLGRPTWPWAWAARDLDEIGFARLSTMSRDVQARNLHPEYLAEALREHIAIRGRFHVQQHLGSALRDLERAVGPSAVIDLLAQEIEKLEQSYE